MKRNRILAMLLSLGLIGSAFAPSVHAKEYKPSTQEQKVQANIPKIIEMLRRQGKITDKMTEEEINKILYEYLKGDPSANYKPGDIEAETFRKLLLEAQDYKIQPRSGEIELLKGEDKFKSQIEKVQKENYEGDQASVTPLVILMDFPDYKFDQMKEKESKYDPQAVFYDKYDTNHYQKMLFGNEKYTGLDGGQYYTMTQYYLEQSGNSFLVNGNVAGWFTAKNPAAYYGAKSGKDNDTRPEELVKEAFGHAVKLHEEGKINLSDYDKINNLDPTIAEPDGIIDCLAVVHSSYGEEEGGGSLGEDAIWSHKFVILNDDRTDVYRLQDKNGKEWAGYTYFTVPQNCEAGVLSHEFAHALGYPDEYDTKYTLNGTGWSGDVVSRWSIMAGGSWAGKVPGSEPVGFSPEAKKFFQSIYGGNWLHGAEFDMNDPAILEQLRGGVDLLLDQASTKGVNNDVVKIQLPEQRVEFAKPTSGTKLYWGGKQNKAENNMIATINLANTTNPKLQFKTGYKIEKDWDYAYVMVKQGNEWITLSNNLTTATNPNGNNLGNGITGNTKDWVDAEFDLTKFVGQEIELKILYKTDAATVEQGIWIDDIKVVDGENIVFEDDAEGTPKFTLNGFEHNDGCEGKEHYYLIEWRNPEETDAGMKNIIGEVPGGFEYSPGMVVWYLDYKYDARDNWTLYHPGEGRIGVVDADQNGPIRAINSVEGPERNALFYLTDAAFSLRREAGYDYEFNSSTTTGDTVHVRRYDPDTFMQAYFDDSRDYTNIQDGKGAPISIFGRKLTEYGLKVYVTGESKDRSVVRIHIVLEDQKK